MTFRRLCLLLIIPFAAQLHADIFTWKDAAGRTHFGDRPPTQAQAEPVKLRINTYRSPEIKPLRDVAPASDQQVVMYGTDWCGVCKRAKRYFREKNIPFRQYDVEKSAKGRQDYRRLKGRGVPIILVGNQRINGFSKDRFESIYRGN